MQQRIRPLEKKARLGGAQRGFLVVFAPDQISAALENNDLALPVTVNANYFLPDDRDVKRFWAGEEGIFSGPGRLSAKLRTGK